MKLRIITLLFGRDKRKKNNKEQQFIQDFLIKVKVQETSTIGLENKINNLEENKIFNRVLKIKIYQENNLDKNFSLEDKINNRENQANKAHNLEENKILNRVLKIKIYQENNLDKNFSLENKINNLEDKTLNL